MKPIALLFFSFVLVFNGFLVSKVVNQDKPQLGDWDLKVKKVWEIGKYGKK